MNIPIVFIHINDTPYLKYSLKIANRTNKHIFFIGDDNNFKYISKYDNITFIHINEFIHEREKSFNDNYEDIKSSTCLLHSWWMKFNYLKYLVLYNFCNKYNFEKIWTFDSDTLIVTNLNDDNKMTDDYSLYDCIILNKGALPSGIITQNCLKDFNTEIIDRFVNKNSRFTDLKKYYDTKVSWPEAYTAMASFNECIDKYKFNCLYGDSIINSSFFDSCIFKSDGFVIDESIKTSDLNFIDKRKAKLYTFNKSGIYNKLISTNEEIKLHTINLSWVKLSTFKLFTDKINAVNI